MKYGITPDAYRVLETGFSGHPDAWAKLQEELYRDDRLPATLAVYPGKEIVEILIRDLRGGLTKYAVSEGVIQLPDDAAIGYFHIYLFREIPKSSEGHQK
jgi:hypothetical protein